VTISKTDLAWAAGFLDGEGCITIIRVSNRYSSGTYYVISLQVTQRVRKPLDKLANMFGGEVRRHNLKQRGGYWYWYRYGNNALEILEKVLPFLVLKEAQAKIAIDFQLRRRAIVGSGIPLVDRQRNQDEKDYERIRRLKVQ
jgi:LAGLIDADG endonuclease